MITSDEVLSERSLPSEVVFIGGGVIALEFSHVYARAGTKVTILEALPRVLAGVDTDAVDRIIEESERIGGRIVGRNIVEGPRHRPDYACIPSCVYTVPTIASVGLTEASAKEKELAVTVQRQNMLDWLSARTFAETVAWAKVIVDETSDQISRCAYRRTFGR